MQPTTTTTAAAATVSDAALDHWQASSSTALLSTQHYTRNQTAASSPSKAETSSSLDHDHQQRHGSSTTLDSNVESLSALFTAPVDRISLDDAAAHAYVPVSSSSAALRSRATKPSSVKTTQQPLTQTQQRKTASAAKRARRSEIERQSRERRMGSVAHMRNELEGLEHTYAQLMQPPSSSSSSSSSSDSHSHSAYLALAADACALRQQQTQLRSMLRERQLFYDAVRAHTSTAATSDTTDYSAVAYAAFTPLTPSKCFAIVRESLDVIRRFEVGRDAVSSGATFCGWADRRRVDTETSSMHFSFTKSFRFETVERLRDLSWTTFCDEAKMRTNVFSSNVDVRLHILQVINDDVCVVRRQTKYVAMERAFHTVYLLFRIETATGYKICFRTIAAPSIQHALEDGETWIDIFHWTHLTRLTDESGAPAGAELVFGGSIGAGVMKFAMHWMLELAMTVVRWENACVAPMALPPSSASSGTEVVAGREQ